MTFRFKKKPPFLYKTCFHFFPSLLILTNQKYLKPNVELTKVSLKDMFTVAIETPSEMIKHPYDAAFRGNPVYIMHVQRLFTKIRH